MPEPQDYVIAKDAWRLFCDGLSPMLAGEHAELEVAALGLGDQIAAAWAPLLGLSYDDRDDVFSVAVEGLDHLVSHPRSLAARWQGPTLESLAITDGEGALHLVKLHAPLSLPSPASLDA